MKQSTAAAVVLLSFMLFIFSTFEIGLNSPTGFAVEEAQPAEETATTTAEATAEVAEATKDSASGAITDAKALIDEMVESGFSVAYVNDELLEAERTLEKAGYAEILRNESASENAKSESRLALKLIDWENITYSDVLVHTDRIKERKDAAFLLFDSISAALLKIQGYESEGFEGSEARAILEDAETSFYEERYSESEELLEEISINLEAKKEEAATLNVLRADAQSFIELYWKHIAAVAFFLIAAAFMIRSGLNIARLKKRITKMKAEKNALLELMKKTQTARYKENKISESVYNIRIQQYKKRITEIEQTLPVLEARVGRKK